MSRSTLTDLFHAAAEKLVALSDRLLQLVVASEIVLADETSLLMQKPNRRGYVWTFIAGDLITYRLSALVRPSPGPGRRSHRCIGTGR